jgi:hypothetical protein
VFAEFITHPFFSFFPPNVSSHSYSNIYVGASDCQKHLVILKLSGTYDQVDTVSLTFSDKKLLAGSHVTHFYHAIFQAVVTCILSATVTSRNSSVVIKYKTEQWNG